MKRFFNKYIIGVLLVAPALGSCSSDYLETTSTDSVSPPTLFATTENAKGAINGIAKLMTMQWAEDDKGYGQGFNGEGTVKLYNGEYPGNNFSRPRLTGWRAIFNMEYMERNSSVYDNFMWTYYYRMISNSNAVLENIAAAEGPESDRQFIKAQAYTFRAYAYMQLVQLYAKRWSDDNGSGSYIVLKLNSTVEELPFSTTEDIMDQIYADLDNAIDLFIESGEKATDLFLPSLNAAYGVYARAAMVRQDWETALENAKLARDGYPLMSNEEYGSGFCDPTSEWIWYCYGSSQETLYYWSYQAYIAYNANSSITRGYRTCISSDLLNKVPDTDYRKNLFFHPGIWADQDPDKDGYQNDYFSKDYDMTDSEVVDPDFNIVLDENFKEEAQDYILETAPYSELYPTTASVNVYEHKKIAAFGGVADGNFNLIRSSEMVLIEAEANYRLGNESEAQAALNELNAGSGRDETYECTATGNDLFEEIVTYRGLELWGEGFDWFDMKRWGRAIDRTSISEGGSFSATMAVTIESDDVNNWQWVTPLNEVDYNSALSEP